MTATIPAPVALADPADIAEVLTKARALITEPDAWLKRQMYNVDRTAFCAIGAVSHAAGTPPEEMTPRRYFAPLADALPKGVGLISNLPENITNDLLPVIARYNDAKTITHDDVLALFDRAIAAVSA